MPTYLFLYLLPSLLIAPRLETRCTPSPKLTTPRKSVKPTHALRNPLTNNIWPLLHLDSSPGPQLLIKLLGDHQIGVLEVLLYRSFPPDAAGRHVRRALWLHLGRRSRAIEQNTQRREGLRLEFFDRRFAPLPCADTVQSCCLWCMPRVSIAAASSTG